jgi:hypothetical protein
VELPVHTKPHPFKKLFWEITWKILEQGFQFLSTSTAFFNSEAGAIVAVLFFPNSTRRRKVD